MFKVFYIEDENGKYISEDGSKRWTRLTGQAYDFASVCFANWGSFTTVDYRRKCVLKKLKSFFKFLS